MHRFRPEGTTPPLRAYRYQAQFRTAQSQAKAAELFTTLDERLREAAAKHAHTLITDR